MAVTKNKNVNVLRPKANERKFYNERQKLKKKIFRFIDVVHLFLIEFRVFTWWPIMDEICYKIACGWMILGTPLIIS